jgi:hypothetical protein
MPVKTNLSINLTIDKVYQSDVPETCGRDGFILRTAK